MEYLCDLVYEFGQVANKSDPKCLQLTKIATSCKFIAPNEIATNTAQGDLRTHSPPYIDIGETVNFGEKSGDTVLRMRKHNAHLWEMIAGQVRDARGVSKYKGIYSGAIRQRMVRKILTAETSVISKAANASGTISPGRSRIPDREMPFSLKFPRFARPSFAQKESATKGRAPFAQQINVSRAAWIVLGRRQTSFDQN